MRGLWLAVSLCLVMWLSGCATARPVPTTIVAATPAEPEAQLASAALVFDPPITSDKPMPDLSRAPREPSAFVGFDQTITTVYSLRFDDQQLLDRRGLMNRRATTVRFGVSTR